MKAEDIPVVDAVFQVDGVCLKMWCQYCKQWHFHGKGEGHRRAHCIKDTPYKKTGYILRLKKEQTP